ncbi:MAG: hypothetical protein CH6_1071 [Candidatus Kapaibacterium sp.]|nr:MAG: hypothetical protein CH6_1071 [Candidatus Kapabacteria bacterium]
MKRISTEEAKKIPLGLEPTYKELKHIIYKVFGKPEPD